MKNLLQGYYSRFKVPEERISEPQDRSIGIMQCFSLFLLLEQNTIDWAAY